MKQMKFLAIAFTLLMSVAFTSCMDSGTNSNPQGAAIVEVVDSYMGFTTMKTGDITFNPTSASLATVGTTNGFKPSSTDIAYILYEYDPESSDNANFETTKKLTIDLKFAISLDATSHVTEAGSSRDSVSTAPIIEIAKNAVATDQEFHIMNNRYLTAGINYYLSGSKMHTFTLVCHPEEITADAEDLKVYLRHRSQEKEDFTGGDISSARVGGQYPSLFFFAFDLQEALDRFITITGKNGGPLNIVVETDVNPNSTKLFDATKKTYTIKFKSDK